MNVKSEYIAETDVLIVEEYYPTGALRSRHYSRAGEPHREDGPTFEKFYADGALESREWYINGQLHREDGPAIESFYSNCNGSRHRLNGAAIETFSKDGRCVFARYYLNGKPLLKAEHSRQATLQKLLASHTANRELSL
jgi:antitoxin component YwqK of YwqJK toxin-antitoxin module